MQYEILQAAHSDVLVRQVNEKIKDGYKPIGGVMYWSSPNSNMYDVWAQAVVKGC